MDEAARQAWGEYLAERIAERLDADDWIDVIDAISVIVGHVDYDAELERLVAATG